MVPDYLAGLAQLDGIPLGVIETVGRWPITNDLTHTSYYVARCSG